MNGPTETWQNTVWNVKCIVTQGVVTDWYTNRAYLVFGGPPRSNFSNVVELRNDGQYSTGDLWELRYTDATKDWLTFRTYSMEWRVFDSRLFTMPLRCAIGQRNGLGTTEFTDTTSISAEVSTLP